MDCTGQGNDSEVIPTIKISPMQDLWSTPLEWLSSTRDLDLGSGHTANRHAYSSTSNYTPNFIVIAKTFCGRMDLQTYVRTY